MQKNTRRTMVFSALTVFALIGMVAINADGGPCTSGYGYLLCGPFVIIFGILTLFSIWRNYKLRHEDAM